MRRSSDIPSDMTITMHLCRGNFRSTFVASGGYEPVAEILFNTIKVHGYFMEYDCERAGGFEPLRFLPKGKTVVLGLVTSKTGQLESRDTILRRIEEAAKFAPLDQLALSPQCGFASTEEGNTLAEDEQWAKLRMIVEIADEVWGNTMKRTKPPFRADHVGSLLRPAALQEAREKRAKGEISAADLKAVEDREIERVIKKQEEVGLQAVTDGEFRRSWWHLDFLWGLDGVERHVMDERRRVRGGEDARRRHQGHRQGRLLRPSDDRALQVRRRSHQGHAEDHHSGAVRDLRPPDADADRQEGLPGPRRLLPRRRAGVQQGRARVRGRRLPLSPARRGVHRDAVRREVPPADARPRRRSRKARRDLRRPHQRGDVGHSRPT